MRVNIIPLPLNKDLFIDTSNEDEWKVSGGIQMPSLWLSSVFQNRMNVQNVY